MAALRMVGAHAGARASKRMGQPSPRRPTLNEHLERPPSASAPGPRGLDLKARAAAEEPRQYLWRFGFGRAEFSNPRLEIAVDGHKEDEGHTWYIINSTLHHGVAETKNQGEDSTSNGGKGAVSSESGAVSIESEAANGPDDIQWTCRRRLCDLREELHDRVKELMGPAYSAYFDDTPFARHGGLPGTTARLRSWLTTLAECANTGALNSDIQAFVLRFLEAPVPEDSDAALLQAAGRCVVCTLLIEVPGRDLCVRCQMLRSDAVSTLQEKFDDSAGSPGRSQQSAGGMDHT